MQKVVHSSINLKNKGNGVYLFDPLTSIQTNSLIRRMVFYSTEEIKTLYSDVFFKIGFTDIKGQNEVDAVCGNMENFSNILSVQQLNNGRINFFGPSESCIKDEKYLGLQIRNISSELWSRQIIGIPEIISLSTSKNSGYYYILGTYISNIVFDNSTSTLLPNLNNGKQKTFITKYDISGNFIWNTYIVGTNDIRGVDIHVNKNNDIVVCGVYDLDIQLYNINDVLSPITLPNVTQQHTFIVCYSSSGIVKWTTIIGPSIPTCIITDLDSFIYVSGYFNTSSLQIYTESGTILETTLENESEYISFIVKYDTEGHILWNTRIDGLNNWITKLRTDKDDNVYCVGFYEKKHSNPGVLKFYDQEGKNINYSGISLSISGNVASFISKFDSNGHVMWATKIDTASSLTNVIIKELAIDLNNCIHILGSFDNNLLIYEVGNLTSYDLPLQGNEDTFLIKYDSDGLLKWSKNMFSPSSIQIPESIVIDKQNNIFVSVFQVNKSKTFIVKYNPEGIDEWFIKLQQSSSPTILNIDYKNDLYVSGIFRNRELISEKLIDQLYTVENPYYYIPGYNSSGYILKYDTSWENLFKQNKITTGNIHVLIELEGFQT